MIHATSRCRLPFALVLGISTCLFGTRSAATGQEQAYYREIRAPRGSAGGLVFTPDSKLLATGAGDAIIVCNADDGKVVSRMQLPRKLESFHLTFAQQG